MRSLIEARDLGIDPSSGLSRGGTCQDLLRSEGLVRHSTDALLSPWLNDMVQSGARNPLDNPGVNLAGHSGFL